MQVRQVLGWLFIPLLAVSANAQQLSGSAVPLNVPQSLDQLLAAGNQSPYSGSVPSAKLIQGVVDLKVEDAITLGLRFNLGIVLSGQTTAQAKASRLKELSNMLPQLNGSLRESEIKASLPAEGFSFQIPGLALPNGIRFSNSDARVSMTENLVDFHDIENTRAASANVRAAGFNFNSAKETVTLAVAASYLLVIAAESQVDAATAELKTAEALQQLAEDRESAGLTPNVDTLRARVELQVRRQNLITRPDYLALDQQVKAAELQKRAAEAERLPSLGISGDYGVLGTHPDNAFPTWTVGAGIKIPIFQGGKVEADIRQADAVLQQRKAQRDDMRGRIEQDVADAILDVSAAAEQVEVAKATLDYAQQTLTQSQDRFSAGITNNIEVIQAQEALANANQQYISSLYSHNIAKVLLARALGAAEQTLRQVLSDDQTPAAGSVAIPDQTPASPAPSK